MEKVKLINLTPHDVHIIGHKSFIIKDGNPHVVLKIPPSGVVARVRNKTFVIEQVEFEGHVIDITDVKPIRIENLPDPQKDTYYIVSI